MKKVLVITYHWPPSGGIGVLRCLKLVKYLREFGWEPVVFTAKDASYQFLDESNFKDIPENLEVHQVPLFEPINWFKKVTGRSKNKPLQSFTGNSGDKKRFLDLFSIWIRGNFFIPDARASWIKPSVNYLEEYLKTTKIDAILTDGPPHTNTVIGMRLAQKFTIPWLADFQDPWTQVDYYSKMRIGKRANRIHHQLEQEVFRTASKITIASPTWKRDLEQIGAKDVSVWYYGYDESDFKTYAPRKNAKFTFFHGGLLGDDRNPDSFFRALSCLINDFPKLKDRVEIRLAGEIDAVVMKSIEINKLTEITTTLGMIPRQRVYEEYASASVLLLPINKAANAQGRIPGKLFEMMRSGKPLLIFGPDNGDVKSIVESRQLGKSYRYEDEKDIYNYLKNSLINGLFENFEKAKDVTEFSNEAMTGQIASYLNEIIDGTK